MAELREGVAQFAAKAKIGGGRINLVICKVDLSITPACRCQRRLN